MKTHIELERRKGRNKATEMNIDFNSIITDKVTEATELSSDVLNQYRELMLDIKHRSDFIYYLNENLPHNIGWLESVALQIRKQLEDLAYACFVANAQHMSYNITKQYKPEYILSKIEKVVSDCWPEPVTTYIPSPVEKQHPRDAGTIDSRPVGDWLTRDELRRVYGQLGDLLHNRNPLRNGAVDINYFVTNLSIWHLKIIRLLTEHKIPINSTNEMYVVQVSPEGVTITTFARIA